MMGFLLSSEADMEDTNKYFRALQRAQREIDIEPEPYKHYYARELPADLGSLVDVRRLVQASGSSSSRTHATCTNARSAGCRCGISSLRSRRPNPGSKTRCSCDCASPAQHRTHGHATPRVDRTRPRLFPDGGHRPVGAEIVSASCPAGRESSTSSARRTRLRWRLRPADHQPLRVGSVCNAGAGLGKFVPDAYGMARRPTHVRRIRRPPAGGLATCRLQSVCARAVTSTCRTDWSRSRRWSTSRRSYRRSRWAIGGPADG